MGDPALQPIQNERLLNDRIVSIQSNLAVR